MSQPTTWEYATVPLLTHATKQILDQWGADGWELVAVLPGPTGEQHVAVQSQLLDTRCQRTAVFGVHHRPGQDHPF